MKYEVLLEKYRPRKLDDIIGQDDIIERLKVYVKCKGFPNLMFVGPPGTGKTSSAICLALELHGNLLNFKEMNASDQRGIEAVRKDIKEYAETKPIGQEDFKVLFLDECDALTYEAQSALRRTMEKHTSTCKFILSCNYSSKVIEPIQSRCTVFRFKGISVDSMKKRLVYIADNEGITLNNTVLEAIIYVAERDMRKAINCLEISSLINKNITVDSVYKSSGLAHPDNIIKLLHFALKGNFMECLNYLDILMIDQGLSSFDILKQMFNEVLNLNISDKMKIDIFEKIGDVDFRISEGSNELIQMKYLITQIIKIGE